MQRSELLKLGGQQEVRGGLVGWQSGHFRRAAQDCQQAKLQVARPLLAQRHTIEPGGQRGQHVQILMEYGKV